MQDQSMSSQPSRTPLDKRNSSGSMKRSRPYRNGCQYCRGGEDSDIEQEDPQQFAASGIQEFLELDPRPTFVLHQNTDFEESDLNPIFHNPSFHPQLFQDVFRNSNAISSPQSLKASISDFRSWMATIINFEAVDSGSVPNFAFHGHNWTAFPFCDRWAVFSGSPNTQELKITSLSHQSEKSNPKRTASLDTSKDVSLPRTTSSAAFNKLLKTIPTAPANFVTPGTPDWTIPHPVGELSPHISFARSIDWASTSLGDMNTWSKEFRQVANLLMRNPHPAALFWGDELTVMYNKAYADGVAGHKHPGLMGTGFRGPFAELWDFVSATFDECVKTYVTYFRK